MHLKSLVLRRRDLRRPAQLSAVGTLQEHDAVVFVYMFFV